MDICKDTIESLVMKFGSQSEPDQKKDMIEDMSTFTPTPVHELHNRVEPAVELTHEKVRHRLVAVLKATGSLTDREIAELTGYSATHVSTICKQPSAEKMILERMHGTGDAAMKVLQDASVAAAKRLVQIAETAENMETKRKANNDILDRKYGKPNQPYSVSQKAANELHDSELAKIAQGN